MALNRENVKIITGDNLQKPCFIYFFGIFEEF